MPEPISDLKQWFEGLGKDVAMRPPFGDEEVPAQKQVKEKKRKDVPSSLVLENKKPAKKSCKPKWGSSVMPLESICRLMDEPEEGEEDLDCVRANVLIQQSSESAEVNKGTLAIIPEREKDETIPSRADMVEGETEGRTSREVEDISKDELGIVDISGSPQISDAMIGESSVLRHEAFLRIREEHQDEVQNLIDKSDSYKFLSEKLREDLLTTRDEHEEMAEFEHIKRLNFQVDELIAEGEIFKENMDTLASKKQIVQAQLESVEAQLWAAKENALVIDVEVNQAKAKSMVKHAKWKARREDLEEVSAQGFDVQAEIENSKAEENRARRLAFPEEDSDSSSEYEGREDPEDASSDEDQAI
nr:glutamic acid-rich protein-like [Nicotiana tomentosiformis]